LPIQHHPAQGCIVIVKFDAAFREPEMVKPRPCIVVSKPMKARPLLCTVVPLSTSAPQQEMPYHCRVTIPFTLPKRWNTAECWVKADMIYAAGFHRIDLLRLGKDATGRRRYQKSSLPEETFRLVQRAILHGLGMSHLTRQV
jgi:mRNA interferase MazF